MLTLILGLVLLNVVALPLLTWWAVSATRRQRNNDLRYHRDILLAHIHTELILQESRLIDRLRALK